MDVISPQIRLTGLLVEGGRLLVVRQRCRACEHWNLPGGHLEFGETLEEGLRREMAEKCGLAVEVGELLYVTDRFRRHGSHVVDMAFLVSRASATGRGAMPPLDAGEIDSARMADPQELPSLGFSERFARLVASGFPDRGTYQGDFHAFYGTPQALRVVPDVWEDVPHATSGRLVGASAVR